MMQYLVVINVVSFIVYFINYLLYRYTDKSVDKLVTILCVLFGSIGIMIAFLILDRNFEKQVLMSRVFLVSMFIIQVIILIFIFDLKSWFYSLKIFRNYVSLYYLLIINSITFSIFGLDKYRAIYSKKRISNTVLLFFSFIGGSIGALIAMKSFRHKTKKDYYIIGIKYIMLMQIFVLIFIFMI